jgi:hypothetical protein
VAIDTDDARAAGPYHLDSAPAAEAELFQPDYVLRLTHDFAHDGQLPRPQHL